MSSDSWRQQLFLSHHFNKDMEMVFGGGKGNDTTNSCHVWLTIVAVVLNYALKEAALPLLAAVAILWLVKYIKMVGLSRARQKTGEV